MAIKLKYIATLHIGLVTFLGDLTDTTLHHYANYFLRNVQYQESHFNVNYVPNAINKIGLTFKSLEEVKDSKDYKAVLDLYIADKEATKSKWTKYHNEIDNLTHLGLPPLLPQPNPSKTDHEEYLLQSRLHPIKFVC